MERTEWLRRISAGLKRCKESPAETDKALRDAIAVWWEIAKFSPQEIHIAFREVSEEDINRFELCHNESSLSHTVAKLSKYDANELGALILGVLRDLDNRLSDSAIFSTITESFSNHLCSDGSTYVIPRFQPRSLRDTGPGNGLLYRGLVFHRCLPRKVGDYEIDPVWRFETASLGVRDDSNSVSLGAALFKGFQLAPADDGDDFLSGSVDGDDIEQSLELHLKSIFSDGVIGVVWPELSMPPKSIEVVRSRLQRIPFGERGEVTNGLAALGSWHKMFNGKYYNTMPVYDFYGRHLLSYRKSIIYTRGELTERAEPDLRLPILISADSAIAFGICLDFCELELDNPYLGLDVDLVLIASLGNQRTMDGHLVNASTMNARVGARAFVCQQSDEQSRNVGFVFPAKDDGQVTVSVEWNVRKLKLT